jgi:hypothetical protein
MAATKGNKRQPKKRGRPEKAARDGERVSLGLKVTPEIKRLLSAATAVSGRTQSQEAEFRLERSFLGIGLLREASELAYGRQMALLLEIISREIRVELARSGISVDQDWLNDPTAFDRVRATVSAIFVPIEHAEDAPRRKIVGEPAGGATSRFFIGIGDSSFSTMAPWRDRVREIWGGATIDRVEKWNARRSWESDSTNRRDGVPSP